MQVRPSPSARIRDRALIADVIQPDAYGLDTLALSSDLGPATSHRVNYDDKEGEQTEAAEAT